jgi:ankyrin repeat protein
VAVIKLLKQYGADLTAKDNDGRTIWHYSAANNDFELLRALLELDANKTEALRQKTKIGRTPLAEAFAYVRELIGYGPSQNNAGGRDEKTWSIKLLLENCKDDPACFESDVPLLCFAAEWGNKPIIEGLKAFGAPCTTHHTAVSGSTPFHFLNFSATADVITTLRKVLEDAEIQVLNNAGLTAAETIFLNFLPAGEGAPSNAHPSNGRQLDVAAYSELLTEEVIKSVDSDGKTLWERFCNRVILRYSSSISYWPRVAEAITAAVGCLIDKGAIEEYERRHETSALLVLVNCIWDKSELIPSWLVKIYLRLINAAKYFDKIKDEPNIILTLQWAVGVLVPERYELVGEILSRGVSVHTAARDLSTLDAACLPGNCDLRTFNMLLERTDKARLNEVSKLGRTALQTLCIIGDEPSSSSPGGQHHPPKTITQREEKIKAMIAAGGDPNLPTKEGPLIVLAILRNRLDAARTLLDCGVECTRRSDDELDIALAAATRGYRVILEIIKERWGSTWPWKSVCTVDFPRNKFSPFNNKAVFPGCNAIHFAAMNGQLEPIKFYVENGYLEASEPCQEEKVTALHFAAGAGAADCIKYLVSKGVDVNSRAADGATPLHNAVWARHSKGVRALLEAGCDVTPLDKDGMAPLTVAMCVNTQKCIDLLLEASAGESGPDADGTVVMAQGRKAAVLADAVETTIRRLERNVIPLCEVALRHGCPVDALLPSCGGCTPLLLCVRQSKVSGVRFFLDRGAKKFAGSCVKHHPSGYNVLLEACANHGSTGSLSALLGAAMRLGYNWAVAPVTPLHIAVQSENYAAVVMIVRHIKHNQEAYR